MANQEKDCYIAIEGEKYGPLSEQDIRELYSRNEISGDTLFYREGMKSWISLSRSGIIGHATGGADAFSPPSDVAAGSGARMRRGGKRAAGKVVLVIGIIAVCAILAVVAIKLIGSLETPLPGSNIAENGEPPIAGDGSSMDGPSLTPYPEETPGSAVDGADGTGSAGGTGGTDGTGGSGDTDGTGGSGGTDGTDGSGGADNPPTSPGEAAHPTPTPTPTHMPTPTPTSTPTPTPTSAEGSPDSQQPEEPGGAGVVDVEREVLAIRKIWTEARALIDSGSVLPSGIGSVKIFDTSDRTRMADVTRGANDLPYSRMYCFHDGQLIFAFWSGDRAHRFYFKNEKMFRWIDTPATGDATTYDNRSDLAEYTEWEKKVRRDVEELGIME